MLGKRERTDRQRIYKDVVMLERKDNKLHKPRHVGTAVLVLSKVIMYNFHSNYIIENFPDAKLLFALKDNEWFDFSNYPPDHYNFNESKKLIPGFFKDEFGGNIYRRLRLERNH